MDTELGRNMILWTVRLSVILYAVVAWRCLFPTTSGAAGRRQTVAWSLSWLLCVAHVMCAYHFEHHWSQQAALKHTAEMTERVVGIDWGGGLYINFMFLAWWGVDVYQLMRGKAQRTAGILQGTAAFMMFNATVVFGPTWWIIPTVIFATAVAIRFRRRTSHRDSDIA